MSKKLAIEKANKRLLMEDMQPLVYFNEHELLKFMCEVCDYDISGPNEIPANIKEVFQKALVSKGRNINPPNPPKGAYM